jgi:TPR repeat protein
MMIRGQGGAREPVDALVPLQKACDWDHPAGCYMLGLVTRESYGSLRIDVIRTAFQRACALGDARGCDAPLTSQ